MSLRSSYVIRSGELAYQTAVSLFPTPYYIFYNNMVFNEFPGFFLEKERVFAKGEFFDGVYAPRGLPPFKNVLYDVVRKLHCFFTMLVVSPLFI